MTKDKPEWPRTLAAAAGSDGISYALIEYPGCMRHLAEFRHGKLQRFLKLRRRYLRQAFGAKEGDWIWTDLVRFRQAQRR
jgi:hypothetical protein